MIIELSQAKLKKLADSEGLEIDEVLESAVIDSVSPGICVECDYTCEVEPDQDQGYCEACGKNTVVSAAVLAGLI